VTFVGTAIKDAYSTGLKHCFFGKNCLKVGEPTREFDEFMEIVELTLEEFKAHIRSGELSDTDAGFMVLDHLKLL
jgi:hypothetical protein